MVISCCCSVSDTDMGSKKKRKRKTKARDVTSTTVSLSFLLFCLLFRCGGGYGAAGSTTQVATETESL